MSQSINAADRADDDDRPIPMRLRIVDVIDCIAANVPDTHGRPISMLTLAHRGELEQPLAISLDDTKLLVTKLLQSLSDHGSETATFLLDQYFSKTSGEDADAGERG